MIDNNKELSNSNIYSNKELISPYIESIYNNHENNNANITSIFDEKTHNKILHAFNTSDSLYKKLETSLAVNNLDDKELRNNYNLTNKEIDYLDHLVKINIRYYRKIIFFQFLFGSIYCFMHSKKLYKSNRGVIKSSYCWFGLLFSIYFSIVISMNLFKFNVKPAVDKFVIKKVFLNISVDKDLNDNNSFIHKYNIEKSKLYDSDIIESLSNDIRDFVYFYKNKIANLH